MRMVSQYLTAMLLLIAVIVGSSCAKSEAPLEEDLANIFSTTAELRGLSPKSEVKYQFITPEQLREEITRIFEEEYSLKEARIDQEVYALLDLMQEDQCPYRRRAQPG